MVGFEMLAQVQRDLTAEKVILFILHYIIVTNNYILQAAAALRALPDAHYKKTWSTHQLLINQHYYGCNLMMQLKVY